MNAHVYVCHVMSDDSGTRRESWEPWKWSYRQLGDGNPTLVLCKSKCSQLLNHLSGPVMLSYTLTQKLPGLLKLEGQTFCQGISQLHISTAQIPVSQSQGMPAFPLFIARPLGWRAEWESFTLLSPPCPTKHSAPGYTEEALAYLLFSATAPRVQDITIVVRIALRWSCPSSNDSIALFSVPRYFQPLTNAGI